MGLKIISYKEYTCDYKGHQVSLDGPREIKNGRTVHVFAISNQPTKVLCGRCYSAMDFDLLSMFLGATHSVVTVNSGVKDDQTQRKDYVY